MDILWFFSSFRSPALDAFFKFVTLFGQESLALIIMCVLFWCVNKQLTYKIGMCFFFSALTVQGLKIMLRVPRPWVIDPSFEPVEGSIKAATGYSFPSGHTQTATSIYGTMAVNSKKNWQRVAFTSLAVLVGISRLYLGVHTLKDVLAAFLIALILSFSLSFLMDKIKGKKGDILLCLTLALYAFICAAFALYMYNSGAVEANYAADLFKSAGAAFGFAVSFYIEKHYIDFSVSCTRLCMQAVKVAIGAGVLIALRSGLKVILGASLMAGFVRYFIMIIWAIAIYPAIIKKVTKRKQS